MFQITTWYGTFICDDDGKPVQHKLFPKEPHAIAERLRTIESGEILTEEKDLVQSSGLESFSVFERRLESLGGLLTEEKEMALSKYEYDKKILHDAMVELAKMKLRDKTREEEHIMHAINSLDEQTHSFNILLENLKDWYALHFPELERLVSRKEFVALISEKGDRDSINLVEDSIGSEITDSEKEVFKVFGSLILEADKTMANLKKYVEDQMKTVAPNLNHLAGSQIGARLISYAGGLEKLANMPSSTIQLLGAEKALFKHLKDGSKPPKHGIIFQHALVHKAPYALRGKIARTFASKISIAARADFYSKNFIAEDLKKSLDKAMGAMHGKQKV